MTVEDQVEDYLASHPEPKQSELRTLHDLALKTLPGSRLWFSDGRNEDGKVVSNPNIGYGCYTITYADGSSREFFQVGLSGNKSGISVYILGLDDKTLLERTFGATIGKASVTGYCIKFKTIEDIDLGVLQVALRTGTESKA